MPGSPAGTSSPVSGCTIRTLMPGNKRPEHCAVIEDGNVLTCWPTKLALAPILAADIIGRLPAPGGTDTLPVKTAAFATMPRPAVAPPPWETTDAWTRDP